ncbi:MAG: hypothetical protein ACD_73C00616G0001, partial [uncultured bacterium]
LGFYFAITNKSTFKVLYNNGKNFAEVPGKSIWADPFEWASNDLWDGGGKGRVIRFPDFGKDQDIFLMDMNGDALPDRIRGSKDNAGGFFDVALNIGTQWVSPVRWTDPVNDKANAGRTTQQVGLMDMNGDGLPDRVVGVPDQNGFQVYLNNGNAFESNPQFWQDPLSAYAKESDYPVGLLYKYTTKGYLQCSTRDLNGDGLPDRALRFQIKDIVTKEIRWGFSVFINKNGTGWAYPVLNAQGESFIDDDHLFLDDPIALNPNDPDKEFAGFFTSRHDLMDMNGDGYLDRVVGIAANNQDGKGGQFKTYLYNGLKPGEVTAYFNPTPVIIEDPIGNITPEQWKGPYLSGGRLSVSTSPSNGNYNTTRFTFFQDLNGDGYPDRITHTKTSDVEKAIVHYYDVNSIDFEDTPDKALHTVNQPLYVLKGISAGVGIDSAVEYVPSTEKLNPNTPGFTDHRFLPFNTYIVHKAYSTDYTMDAAQKADALQYAEGTRHPGMRWLRYDYSGGHLFVRKPTKLLHLYQRFVGFHEITKVPIHLGSDGWQPYHTITRYLQPLGDQDAPLISKVALNAAFDPAGYGHFALTGKPYFQKVILNNQALTVEKSQWDLKNAKPDSLGCNGSCVVNVALQSKIVYELGGGIRGTQKEFQYDDIGNLTGNSDFQISEDGVQKTPLSSTKINYVPGTAFPKKNIFDRVASQTQFKAGETGHIKSFEYDDKGNPVTETFVSTDAAVPSQNNTKTFGAFGNMIEATSFDGVVKKYAYDAKNLFPTEETTSAGGLSLTTKREFNRLLGKASQEIGPNGVGKKVESDDFGRPLNQYLLPANGGAPILDKKYVYTDVVPVKFGLWNINLSRIDVYDIKPDYPAASAQKPAEITFTDGAGGPLQKCTLSEKGNYRVVQSRVSVGGQVEIATEPVFKDTCPFYAELLTTKIITTKKDFMGRPLSI